MKNYSLLLAVAFFGTLETAAQELVSLFPRFEEGVEVSLNMEQDNEDNTIIAGNYYFPTGLGGAPGSKNIWIEKYNSAGQFMWSLSTNYILSANKAELQDIAVDANGNLFVYFNYSGAEVSIGGVTLQGYNNLKSDIAYAKIDPAGDVLWIKGVEADQNPESSRLPAFLSIAANGDILMTGNFFRNFSIDGMELITLEIVQGEEFYPPASYIVRLNNNGEAVWAKSLRNLNSHQSNGRCGPAHILENEEGDLFVHLGIDSAVVVGNDTVISQGPNLSTDLHAIIKTDEEGNFLDDVVIESSFYYTFEELILDNCGNLLVLGSFIDTLTISDQTIIANSERDVFVAKFDQDLNCEWLKGFGSSGGDLTKGLGVNDKNEIFFSFEFWGELSFGEPYTPEGLDMVLVKLDPEGNFVWHVNTVGPGYCRVSALNIDSDNNIHIFGALHGEENVGGTIVETPASSEGYFHDVLRSVWQDTHYNGDAVDCPEITATNETNTQLNNLNVYPNPAGNQIFVELSGIEQNATEIQIINIQGKLIHTQKADQYLSVIDLKDISSGIYFLKLKNQPKQVVKFIKQ